MLTFQNLPDDAQQPSASSTTAKATDWFLLQVNYSEFLEPDFSNLVLQSEENKTLNFTFVEVIPGQKALLNVSASPQTAVFVLAKSAEAALNLTQSESLLPSEQAEQNLSPSQNEQENVSSFVQENIASENLTAPNISFDSSLLYYNFSEDPQAALTPLSFNVSYFKGLELDFSNLGVRLTTAQSSYVVPHIILSLSHGVWALIGILVPPTPYSLDFFAYNPQPPAAELNVTYFAGLEPDFSNLKIQYVSQDGSRQQISFKIASFAPSKWAIVLPERMPLPAENVEFFAENKKPRFNVVSRGKYTSIISFGEGKEIEISNELLEKLERNESVRAIVKTKKGATISQAISAIHTPQSTYSSSANHAAPKPIASLFSKLKPLFSQIRLAPAGMIRLQEAGSEIPPEKASEKAAEPTEQYFPSLAPQEEIILVKSIPNFDLQVVQIDAEDLSLLALLGAEEIYEDKIVTAALADSIPLVRGDVARSEFGLDGEGIAICLLDTGVDFAQPSLGGRAISGYDFVDSDEDASDDNGHGTFMASVIHSIAPNATIVSVRVLSTNGQGWASDVIAGIDYCRQLAKGGSIKILMMGFGGGEYSEFCEADPVAEAAAAAVSEGIFAVASSGSFGDKRYITAPACSQSVVAVASTSKNDSISEFSNINLLVDLLAPGEAITASGLQGAETRSGTSIAASHVAAAAALLLQSDSSLLPSELAWRFKSTGVPIEYNHSGILVNFSRLDIYNAIINNSTFAPQNFSINATNQTFNYSYFVDKLYFPLDVSTKSEKGITITLEDPSAIIMPWGTYHYYLVRTPAFSQPIELLPQHIITSGPAVHQVRIYPVVQETIDYYTVREATQAEGAEGIQTEEKIKARHSYLLSEPSTSFEFSQEHLKGGQATFILELLTDNFVSGTFNISLGDIQIDPNISSCGALSSPNTVYTLNQSISASGSCFSITASNITLDCQGYSITGTNASSTEGIFSNQPYTTIRNCRVSNFTHAIRLQYVSNATITNTTANSSQPNGYGIYLDSSTNTSISSTTAGSFSSYGLHLLSSSQNQISNST
ncbi:MAG: S8 family serine peptidase, partial [Candidatus Micrarchaeota archaeon]|nr:S8 family serine peptidase [Candidatus Micrarchaeota archaeon]